MFKSKWNTLKYEEKDLLSYIYDTYFKNEKNLIDKFDQDFIKKVYKEVKEYYDDSINWKTFAKLYNMMYDTSANQYFKYYDGDIQLSDDHVILEIKHPVDPEEYWYIAREYCEDFEELTGEKIGTAGRMDRHMLVDNTAKNFIDFAELRDLQQSLQKDFIEEINKLEGPDDEEL